MTQVATTQVKVCGITRMEDAEWALECGADALGFVFEPSSPRYVGDSEVARTIPSRIGLHLRCVAVYAKLPPILNLPVGYAAVQAIEGDNFPENHWAVRAIPCRPGLTIEGVLELAHNAQGILLDAYDPDAAGGTGKRADWDLARQLVEEQPKAVILAGGLNPDNVAEAVALVRPFAVDASSGLESAPGVKDRDKVRDFIQAVRGA